jgi:hypothetical protein
VNTLHKRDDDDDGDNNNNKFTATSSRSFRSISYTDAEEALIRIWQLKTAYIVPLILSTAGITKRATV